jgi:hypothetical protein
MMIAASVDIDDGKDCDGATDDDDDDDDDDNDGKCATGNDIWRDWRRC